MAVDHYENFPVASFLLPRRLRGAVEAIYRFARSADDVADEGTASAKDRLRALDAFRDMLGEMRRQHLPSTPELAGLYFMLLPAIDRHDLPYQPFYDLLDAFSQDVTKQRYADHVELADYCRRSANPVGRLLLVLYRANHKVTRTESDAICTALQLINFLQDVAVDLDKDRIYLPQSELARFGVREEDLFARRATPEFRALMAAEVARARTLMLAGAPLARRLPGRIGWELRLIVMGGLRILAKIEAIGYDTLNQRPVLKPVDWLRMVGGVLRYPTPPRSRQA